VSLSSLVRYFSLFAGNSLQAAVHDHRQLDTMARILAPIWFFALKAVQLVVALVVMALTANLVDTFNNVSGWNFTLFVAVFSILVFIYMLVATSVASLVYHRFAFLVLYSLLWVFWLAVWARNAKYVSDINKIPGPLVGTAKHLRDKERAVLAFALIEWFLIMATFGFFGFVFWRNWRGNGPDLISPGSGGGSPFSRSRFNENDHEKAVDNNIQMSDRAPTVDDTAPYPDHDVGAPHSP